MKLDKRVRLLLIIGDAVLLVSSFFYRQWFLSISALIVVIFLQRNGGKDQTYEERDE